MSDPTTQRMMMGAASAEASMLTVGYWFTPYLTSYTLNGNNLNIQATISSLPDKQPTALAYSADGKYLAVGLRETPFINLYKRVGNALQKLSTPAALPPGQVNGVDFSPDGSLLVAVGNTSPYMRLYSRSGDTFSGLANPPNLPTSNCFQCLFSRDGTKLYVTTNSNGMRVYNRSGNTLTFLTSFFGSLSVNNVTLTPDGQYVVIGRATTPYIAAYRYDGVSTYTLITSPSGLPSQRLTPLFSPDGNYLLVSFASSPFMRIYQRSGDVFTEISGPSPSLSVEFSGSFSKSGTAISGWSLSSTPVVDTYSFVNGVMTKNTSPTQPPVSAGGGVYSAYSPSPI